MHPGAARHRRAVSLAEMMIAIVILGLGLLMVATIFPVAWKKARELTESTVQNSCTDIAESTVRSLLRVDGSNCTNPNSTCSSANSLAFAGDQYAIRVSDNFCPNCIGTPLFIFPLETVLGAVSSSRVHYLHLENLLVENRAFQGDEPWRIEGDGNSADMLADPDLNDAITLGKFPSYFTPRVAFNDRVYPPLPIRASLDFKKPDPSWDGALENRRYAWAVFHKLSDCKYAGEVYGNWQTAQTLKKPELFEASVELTRTMTLFYTTLRRPRPTMRYAVQDPTKVADPLDTATPVKIGTLDSDTDLMFPVPWRIQVVFPDGTTNPSDYQPGFIRSASNRSGIPTEVIVNPANPVGKNSTDGRVDDNGFVVDLFQPGAYFIDERSGQVYRVQQRKLMGAAQDEAILTLDREVVLEDIFSPCEEIPSELQPQDRLRTVWVFLPPVRGGRAEGEPLIFDGQQPVVGIDVRTQTFSAR